MCMMVLMLTLEMTIISQKKKKLLLWDVKFRLRLLACHDFKGLSVNSNQFQTVMLSTTDKSRGSSLTIPSYCKHIIIILRDVCNVFTTPVQSSITPSQTTTRVINI